MQQFFKASDAGFLDEVVRLLEHGVPVDAADGNGWTAAMWAVSGGHAEVLGELIRRGADLEARDKDGRTALYMSRILKFVLVSLGSARFCNKKGIRQGTRPKRVQNESYCQCNSEREV